MKILNLEQTADLLHMHANTLQERAAAGQIPGAKIGRAWIFHEEVLDDYLRSEIERQVKERRGTANIDHGTKELPLTGPRIRAKRGRRQLPELPDAE